MNQFANESLSPNNRHNSSSADRDVQSKEVNQNSHNLLDSKLLTAGRAPQQQILSEKQPAQLYSQTDLQPPLSQAMYLTPIGYYQSSNIAYEHPKNQQVIATENEPFISQNVQNSQQTLNMKSLPLHPSALDKTEKIDPVESNQKPRRYCCGSFRTRRTCLQCCGMFIFLFLIFIALLLFFIWPRIPDVKLSEPFIPQGSIPFSFEQNPSTQQSTLIMRIAINVTVESTNYIDFGAKTIQVDGKFLNPITNTAIPGVTGTGHIDNVSIKKMSTTFFTIPILIEYALVGTLTTLRSDPTIRLIAESCGFLGTQKQDLLFEYNVKVGLNIVTWVGYTPSFVGLGRFECPITASEWRAATAQLRK